MDVGCGRSGLEGRDSGERCPLTVGLTPRDTGQANGNTCSGTKDGKAVPKFALVQPRVLFSQVTDKGEDALLLASVTSLNQNKNMLSIEGKGEGGG